MSYIKPRSIVSVILLSIITCGIYGLVVFFLYSSELKREAERNNCNTKLIDPLSAYLLGIITCGIYIVYYNYKQASAIAEMSKQYDLEIIEPTVVLLFTIFFGVGIYINIYNASNLSKAITSNMMYK